MAYLGGKGKGAEHIIKALNNSSFDDMDYVEPFCGYCHILRRVENKKSYTASDNNEILIELLKYIQKGGEHYEITPDEYSALKKNPDTNKAKAGYAAFAYSYNGKFFGGYVSTYKDRNYPEERKRYYDLLYDNDTFQNTEFKYDTYEWIKDLSNTLIYCDPPYANTTEYHTAFDSNHFWDVMREVSKNNYVFISEYTAPADFICIDYKTKGTSLSGKGTTRRNKERLYIHKSKKNDPKIKKMIKRTTNKTRKVKKTRK